MARLAEVLAYEKVSTEAGIAIYDVKCDTGDDNPVTARHYQPPGYAASPLVGDYAALVEAGGEYIAVAFIDPKIAPETAPGEVLIYSRSAPGVIAASALLKADGSIIFNEHVTIAPDGSISTDGSGSFAGDVSTDGSVTVGGSIDAGGAIEAGGTISAPDVAAGGVGLANHVHIGGAPGSPVGPPIAPPPP